MGNIGGKTIEETIQYQYERATAHKGDDAQGLRRKFVDTKSIPDVTSTTQDSNEHSQSSPFDVDALFVDDNIPSDEERDDIGYHDFRIPISEKRVENRKHDHMSEVIPWREGQYFSELIQDGVDWLAAHGDSIAAQRPVVMLFEPPSSYAGTSFRNTNIYRIHDYPKCPLHYVTDIHPCRYAIMTGGAYPAFMVHEPSEALVEHWCKTIPDFRRPEFVQELPSDARFSVYFPLEKPIEHLVDPDVQYHLAGKDVICLMTDKTPKLLPNMEDVRPCVGKVTHGMGSLGIKVIQNDNDEAEFKRDLVKAGSPTFVVTDNVNIAKNLSCHFFIHPNGDVVWIGSSENLQLPDESWSIDSTIDVRKEEEYQELLLPYARDVIDYCVGCGYWGFAGIDVLIDDNDQGFVIDVNPRVTATMPALMVGHAIQRFGYPIGKFRKSVKQYCHRGGANDLIQQVEAYNETHKGEGRVVLFCVYEESPVFTLVNLCAFGHSHEQCDSMLDMFTTPR